MAAWDCPALAVDAVVFDREDRLLLIQRKKEPFKGMYAFPGGGADKGETTEQACARELLEETGLTVNPADAALIGVYSDPARDPRQHTVGVAYLVQLDTAVPVAGDDAATAAFVADWQDKPLAFDHAKILKDALALKARLTKEK